MKYYLTDPTGQFRKEIPESQVKELIDNKLIIILDSGDIILTDKGREYVKRNRKRLELLKQRN